MKVSTKETLKIYAQHMRPYRAYFVLGFIALITAIGASLVSPLFYKWFFDVLTSGEDKAVVVPQLLEILVYIGITYLIGHIGYRTSGFSAIKSVTHTMNDLANTCFSFLHTHSYSFFTDNFAGALVKKVNRFYRSFNRIFDIVYWDLIGLVIRIIVATITLWFVHALFGVILLTWSILFILLAYIVFQYRLKYDLLQAQADSDVTGVLADTITNALNVKLFASAKRESKLFWKTTSHRRDLQKKSWRIGEWLNNIQGLLVFGLEVGLIYFAIILWKQGLVSVGDIVLIQSYLIIIGREVWGFSHVMKGLYEALADAEEMTEIFMTPLEIKDVKRAKELEVTKGEIVFDRVNFSYHKTRKILSNFNLQITPGEKVALVGPSGAGKSTLVKLIFRFFDVTRGKILIDGQKISGVKQKSLMQQVSLVPQDPILFHRTLKENIRYGKPDATDQEVIEAAKLAHCHEFISDLPEQYNTYVGERGVKLSGGERQRVAIARAILKDAPILVLDEATSSLDSESEASIQEALKNLMKGRTTIVIAHRLSTIMEMDRILVMEKGHIIEEGKHADLLKKNGLYKKLWSLQAGSFLQ